MTRLRRSRRTEQAAPLAEDTPTTTTEGSTFIAPAGWTVTVRGAATILRPPEPGSAIAFG